MMVSTPSLHLPEHRAARHCAHLQGRVLGKVTGVWRHLVRGYIGQTGGQPHLLQLAAHERHQVGRLGTTQELCPPAVQELDLLFVPVHYEALGVMLR